MPLCIRQEPAIFKTGCPGRQSNTRVGARESGMQTGVAIAARDGLAQGIRDDVAWARERWEPIDPRIRVGLTAVVGPAAAGLAGAGGREMAQQEQGTMEDLGAEIADETMGRVSLGVSGVGGGEGAGVQGRRVQRGIETWKCRAVMGRGRVAMSVRRGGRRRCRMPMTLTMIRIGAPIMISVLMKAKCGGRWRVITWRKPCGISALLLWNAR